MPWKVIKLQHKMQKASANCKLRARCFAYVRAAFFFCCNMQYVLTKKKSLVSGKDFQNFRFFLQRMYRFSRKLEHSQQQIFIFSVFHFYIISIRPQCHQNTIVNLNVKPATDSRQQKNSSSSDAFVHTCRERTCSRQLNID